jgi:hypothetical protein
MLRVTPALPRCYMPAACTSIWRPENALAPHRLREIRPPFRLLKCADAAAQQQPAHPAQQSYGISCISLTRQRRPANLPHPKYGASAFARQAMHFLIEPGRRYAIRRPWAVVSRS